MGDNNILVFWTIFVALFANILCIIVLNMSILMYYSPSKIDSVVCKTWLETSIYSVLTV